MNSISNSIAEFISTHFDLTCEEVLKSVTKVDFVTKYKKNLGDYSIPLRRFGKDRCELLVKQFSEYQCQPGDFISKFEIFNNILNIFIDKQQIVRRTLVNITEDDYGLRPANSSGQKIIIEFSSPNIAKPFHAGHLRSTILGQFLVNLHRYIGHEVIAMNYLGDWGKQFGILGLGLQRCDLTVDDLKQLEDPILKLNEIYVDINKTMKKEKNDFLAERGFKDEDECKRHGITIDSKTDSAAKRFFSELENGDAEKKKVWEYIRDVSLQKYKLIYHRMGIHFDVFSGESMYGNSFIPRELQEHPNLVTDKAIYVNLDAAGLGKFVIVKQDGSSLYSLRDITAALDRDQEYRFDQMIYVVACEQDHYFKRLFTVLGLINDDLPDKCRHVSFGMVEGMSTRTGNVVLLEAIMEEAKQEMKRKILSNEKEEARVGESQIEKTAEILGRSAIFIQDFKAERTRNYKFEMSRATDFEGQTGPYLQYSHVRLFNIIEKAAEKGILPADIHEPFEVHLTEHDAHEVILMMADFDAVLNSCVTRCEAQPLVNWLFTFVRCIFKAYNSLSVINCPDPEKASARLLMFSIAKQVVHRSLELIGLTPLEKM